MESPATSIPYRYNVMRASEPDTVPPSTKTDGLQLPESPDNWGMFTTRNVFAINCVLGKEAITVAQADAILGREPGSFNFNDPHKLGKWMLEHSIALKDHEPPTRLTAIQNQYALDKVSFETYLKEYEASRGAFPSDEAREAFRAYTDETFVPSRQQKLTNHPYKDYMNAGQFEESAQPITPDLVDTLAAPDRHILTAIQQPGGTVHASIFRARPGDTLLQFVPDTAEFGGSYISEVTDQDMENLNPAGTIISRWQSTR